MGVVPSLRHWLPTVLAHHHYQLSIWILRLSWILIRPAKQCQRHDIEVTTSPDETSNCLLCLPHGKAEMSPEQDPYRSTMCPLREAANPLQPQSSSEGADLAPRPAAATSLSTASKCQRWRPVWSRRLEQQCIACFPDQEA